MAPRPGPGRQSSSFADQLAVGVGDPSARAAAEVDPGRRPIAVHPLAAGRQDAATRLAVAAGLLPAAAGQLVAAATAALADQVAVIVGYVAIAAALPRVDRGVAPIAVHALALGVERAALHVRVAAGLLTDDAPNI